MATIFTKIVRGEIPCFKIAEDENYLAFLDINPLAEGHCLVIPKIEVDYIFAMEDELLSGLHIFSKKIALAIDESVDCKRVGIAVIGLEVPHAHVHLIPINNINDLSFEKPKLKFTQQEFFHTAEKIKSKL